MDTGANCFLSVPNIQEFGRCCDVIITTEKLTKQIIRFPELFKNKLRDRLRYFIVALREPSI